MTPSDMRRRNWNPDGRARAIARRLTAIVDRRQAEDGPGAPAVTIVVPVFGTEEHLGACLASILRQTFRDFEVIVVDDCSPGDVAGIVGRVAAGDHRVRVVRHAVNQGLLRARLTGASEARGRYLAFVDSDDEVEDFFIKAMYEGAVEHDADLVQCELWEIEPDGTTRRLNRAVGPRAAGHLVLRDGDIVRGFLGKKIWNSLCTKLIRTTVWTTAIAAIDAEHESIFFGEDILITFVLATNSTVFVGVPDHGYRYVRRSTSITKASESERLVHCINDLDAVYRALRPLLAERGESSDLVAEFFRREFARVVIAMLHQASACESSGSVHTPRSPATLGVLGAIVLENARPES